MLYYNLLYNTVNQDISTLNVTSMDNVAAVKRAFHSLIGPSTIFCKLVENVLQWRQKKTDNHMLCLLLLCLLTSLLVYALGEVLPRERAKQQSEQIRFGREKDDK